MHRRWMRQVLIGLLSTTTVFVVLLSGTTCSPSVGSGPPTSHPPTEGVYGRFLPAPALAHLPSEQGPVVLADVAEKAVASVVNISSEKLVRDPGRGSQFGPFFNDPFFRHFFGNPNLPDHQSEQKREKSLGSGVIVSKDGIVLTNNHVIENADQILVGLSDGREFEAKVVGRDPDSDLGVLRLEGNPSGLDPLSLGDSSDLRLGDVVLAIGNPFGVGQTVTMGIVSATGRAGVGIVEYEDFIQTDAAINPGNSGGALVNMKGELVGINTAILSRSGGYQGIGFAIPSNMARPIMESILNDGKVERGWLGVAIQDLTVELKEALKLRSKGVLVSDVTRESPAEKAGIEQGDVITKIDGQVMDSSARLRNTVAAAGPGKKIKVELVRGGENKTFEVALAARELSSGVAKLGPESGALGGLTLSAPNDKLRRRFQIDKDLEGAIVTEVEPGTAAAHAGFHPGDMILELNRKRIRSPQEFSQLYEKARGVVAVVVSRRGSKFYLAFKKP